MAAPDDPNSEGMHYVPHRTVRPIVDSEDTRVDSDGDKMSDADEKEWGTDPNKADTDGDGIEDFDEIAANLNPLVDEEATPEASRRAALDFLADPYKADAIQGDLAAAKKIAEIYGDPMTAAQEQQYLATGGAPLMNIERQRQLLGDLNGATDPREQARWAEALENYKKALGGDPTAYVEMQEQLTGVRPSDHDLAIFIRGGGAPVLAMERQFQLLGSGTERPKEHIARLQALQEQVDKALGGDAKALDVVGASFGMDRGELTLSTLSSVGGLIQDIADPTKFTPGGVSLPGMPQPGGTSNAGGSGSTGGSGAADGSGAPDNTGIDRGRPIEIGVQRGGTGDATTPATPGTPGGPGATPPPADKGGSTPAPAPAPAPANDDPMAGGSRGDGGGTSLPASIGPLPTKAGGSDPVPASPAPAGSQHGGADNSHASTGPAAGPGGNFVPVMNSTDTDILHFERDNGDGTTTVMTADGKEVQTVPTSQLHHEEASTDDGSNPDAGSTDDDGDNVPADDTDDAADDAADDVPKSDDTSDTATAYVNPDADSGGGWSLGDTGGRAFVAGGGFTDGGRDDLASIDLSGATISDRRGLSAHIDPDADSSGGGVLSEVPIDGGGFTDVVRPELAQLDLTGLTPRNPHDGTNAFGVGDQALGTDTGDGSPDGTGPYAPGVAGGDGTAFTAGIDAMSISLDDNAFSLDVASFQLDDFSAQAAGMDGLAAPGGDQMGDPDGDGLPFP